MLKFRVFEDRRPAKHWPLRNTYLIGADGNAVRGSIRFEKGLILCEKREIGSVALACQHRIPGVGELTVQTCLLPERDEPYVLNLELARHRLMLVYVKQEEWGLFELEDDHPIVKRIEAARELFIESLCSQHSDPGRSSSKGRKALAKAIDASEEMALHHSQLLMNRRRANEASPRFPVGCGVALDPSHHRLRRGLLNHFDFVQLPALWRDLAPEEGEYRWHLLDDWIEWASRNRMPILAGPLVSFEPNNLPDWLFIWEHDFDTVRDLIYEHVEQVANRYRNRVSVWKVVSGLHVNNHFSFNFEQLMELTRIATMRVKKIAPQARALIELREPFGEYFGSNPRSIPPMTYADLAVQSGVPFDGFSLQLLMGQAQSGQFTRDLMQISALLDQFSSFGKPVYLTFGAPNEPVTQMMLPGPDSGEPLDDNSGFWRKPWSSTIQAHWLEAVFQIAISKPFVEAAAWSNLVDHPQIELPLAGVVNEALESKAAMRRLANFRRALASTPSGDEPTSRYATVPGALEKSSRSTAEEVS